MRHNAHQSDSNKFFSLQVNGTVIFPLKFSAIPLNPRPWPENNYKTNQQYKELHDTFSELLGKERIIRKD